jgi:hypothetical protein
MQGRSTDVGRLFHDGIRWVIHETWSFRLQRHYTTPPLLNYGACLPKTFLADEDKSWALREPVARPDEDGSR